MMQEQKDLLALEIFKNTEMFIVNSIGLVGKIFKVWCHSNNLTKYTTTDGLSDPDEPAFEAEKQVSKVFPDCLKPEAKRVKLGRNGWILDFPLAGPLYTRLAVMARQRHRLGDKFPWKNQISVADWRCVCSHHQAGASLQAVSKGSIL
ncbi:predicted protein [Histoplasma capsulatum G186AR]|uniref:Uncharacterized protein n=1 Tax=Ajellomyces capsulatus (strain G186AR / H82 / ATCC MYA-2454 / RMSCC 2432) TaxID=447093 RepID=C0NLI4_AJECG|nr:uncharacterized protein HCBG_04364 [Histoplasma capsulatum G186AR]EEH07486.1 predicted protein [Histoplasma capsulatum G186AR]